MSERTLLLFWEGADRALLDPLLAKGLLPNLKRFLGKASSGGVISLPPFSPRPLLVSALTGTRPWQHRVTSGSHTPSQTPPIWEQVGNEPGIAVNVPHAWGKAPATTALVTEAFFAGQESRDDLEDLRVDPKDLDPGIVQLLCPKLTEQVAKDDPLVQMLAGLLARMYSVHNVTASLLETEPWTVAVAHHDFLAPILHSFERFAGPPSSVNPTALCERYGQVVEGSVRLLDFLLGDLLKVAGAANVLIVSTRGRPVLSSAGALDYPLQNPGEGLFLASGPSIRAQHGVGMVGLLDIAPTVQALLGRPPSPSQSGRVLDELLLDRAWPEVGASVPQAGSIPGPDGCDAQTCFELGLDLYDSGQAAASLPFLVQAARLGPESVHAAFWLICAQVDQGLHRAADGTERVLRAYLDESKASSLHRLAFIASQRGQALQVIHLCETAITHGELPPTLSACYSRALMDAAQWDRAIAYLMEEAEHRASNATWLGLARCNLHFKRYQDAEGLARRVLADNPGLAEAYVLRSQALEGLGKRDEARLALHEATKRAPGWEMVREAGERLDDHITTAGPGTPKAPSPEAPPSGENHGVMECRETTAEEEARYEAFLPTTESAGIAWERRVCCSGGAYQHFVGAASWYRADPGDRAHVALRLAPGFQNTRAGHELMASLTAEFCRAGVSSIVVASNDPLDWETIVPGHDGLRCWTTEDWIADPVLIEQKLERYEPVTRRAQQGGWHVRPLEESDWGLVSRWAVDTEFLTPEDCSRLREGVEPGLSGLVCKVDGPLGLLLATKTRRQATLEFITGHPGRREHWPLATLMAMSHLVEAGKASKSYDSFTLTTNLNRSKAMHRLARRLGMHCHARRFHAELRIGGPVSS